VPAPEPELPIDPDLSGDDPAEPSARHRPGSHRRDDRLPRRAHPGILAAIGAGGFIGTLARYQVGLAWPTPTGRFPAATFTINTTGAFAIGALVVVILDRFPASRYLRPFVVVGGLGGWTTMSTLAVEAVTLADGGRWPIAAAYLGASLIAGIVAVVAGMALARAVRRGWPAPSAVR
jgi:CrcB protein